MTEKDLVAHFGSIGLIAVIPPSLLAFHCFSFCFQKDKKTQGDKIKLYMERGVPKGDALISYVS